MDGIVGEFEGLEPLSRGIQLKWSETVDEAVGNLCN